MSRRERDKGRAGEAEVRRLFEAAGFAVRGLERTGDHLAILDGVTLHLEVKRQEVLRLPLWSRQAIDDAPAGALPIVCYRQNARAWRLLARASDQMQLVELLGWREAPLSFAEPELIARSLNGLEWLDGALESWLAPRVWLESDRRSEAS